MEGKLIVFEGLDGSGKATQFNMLVQRLRALNKQVETLDFPQYNKWSSIFVKKYLNGDFGTCNPYVASLFYALDRYEMSVQINKWLDEGKIIVANRYVTSNQAYQAAKIADKAFRSSFLNWLDNIEYNILNLPRPTLVIYLKVPLEISQKLMESRRQKDYINEGGLDMHEKDKMLLKATDEVYQSLANNPSWKFVECTLDGSLLSKEQIHAMVWEKINDIY